MTKVEGSMTKEIEYRKSQNLTFPTPNSAFPTLLSRYPAGARTPIPESLCLTAANFVTRVVRAVRR